MQSEYGICQQMTLHSELYALCVQCVQPADELCCPDRVKLLRLLSMLPECVCVCVCVCVSVCTHMACVGVCCANAYELYIHIQMLPSSSEALITNSQCLR